MAVTVKLEEAPEHFVSLAGWSVMAGDVSIVSDALFEVKDGEHILMTTKL